MPTTHRKDPDQMSGPEYRLWLDDPELFRELEAAGKLHTPQAGGSVPSITRKR